MTIENTGEGQPELLDATGDERLAAMARNLFIKTSGFVEPGGPSREDVLSRIINAGIHDDEGTLQYDPVSARAVEDKLRIIPADSQG